MNKRAGYAIAAVVVAGGLGAWYWSGEGSQTQVSQTPPAARASATPVPKVADNSDSEAMAKFEQELSALELELADKVEAVQKRLGSKAPKALDGILAGDSEEALNLAKLYAKMVNDPGIRPWGGVDFWLRLFSRSDMEKAFAQVAFDPDFERVWLEDEYFDVCRDYLEEFGLPWVLRQAAEMRRGGCNFKTPPEEVPQHLQQPYRDWLALDPQVRSASPLVGISHILYKSYTLERAEHFYDFIRVACEQAGISLQGKDLADIGAGSGFILPIFRRAIGPNAKLYANELEPITLDLLRYTSSRNQVDQVFAGSLTDCGLPENTVDVITMIGVHMGGSGLTDNYEAHSVPWLKSMHRALRSGGYLIIHDGNMDMLDNDLFKKVEACGFKLVKFCESGYYPESSDFCAIFQVQK